MGIGIDKETSVIGGYVYILQSERSARYYIGSAKDVAYRLSQHNSNKVVSTRNKGPWKVMFSQGFLTRSEAQHVEMLLKKKKSKVIIEKIIVDKVIKFKF